MKSILIRDLDPSIYNALKRLADAHHRSMQGELHAILDHAVKMAPPSAKGEGLDLVTVSTGVKSRFRREEIYGNQGR